MPAQITVEDLSPGLEPDLSTSALRPYDRRRDGLTSRRRHSDAHKIVASILAVLALVGSVTAILVLAIEPTAARLQGDIGSLNARLSTTQSQLAALRKIAVHTARQGSRLTRRIGLLDRHMTGLARTVHGLRGSSSLAREQTERLRACFADLQQELGGLTLRTRSVRGHLADVGLSETTGPSASCGAMFSGT